MARGALVAQVINLSLGGGVDTKEDVRAADARQMDIARDVQFDTTRGAQTRKPMALFGNNIFGGGTLANCRRIDTVNGELVVQTDVAVYSWNAQQASWVLRGTHLAVAVTETPRFVTSGDQTQADRAELNGTVVYAWVEAGQAYAAAIDKATGSVLVPTTAIASAVSRPRVVALATKILLFTVSNPNNLIVRAIDPASPAGGIASGGSSVTAACNGPYDVVRAGTQDLVVGAYQRTTTTSYTVFSVTPALSIASSTKARAADGPIAVATIADGTQTQIIRGNVSNVEGDLLTTSTFADVFTAQAIGTLSTPLNNIAVEFAGATATAFWTARQDSIGSSFSTKRNTVTTANVVGTQTTHILMLGIASRAFLYSGRVYVWMVFAEDSSQVSADLNTPDIRAQLEYSYFLYRDDGVLISKAAFGNAGGYPALTGTIPGVAALGGADFAWCGGVRRIIDLGGNSHTGFAERAMRDLTFSFDVVAARRTCRIGRTLYIGGGLVTQYDGVQLSEVGFMIYPWYVSLAPVNSSGLLDPGTYSYKSTYASRNGQGETERSTTASGASKQVIAPNDTISFDIRYLWVTLKSGRLTPSVEVWRTPANPGAGAPAYLVTSNDPSVTTGDNRFLPNDPTLFGTPSGVFDDFSDAVLTTKEANPENGGVLEALAPPGASIIVATDTRVLLAGVAGSPDSVWYSRLRDDGQVASFHDGNVIPVPPGGDAITALAFLNDTLVVFRVTSIYALPGIGFDNKGQGQNFGPSNRLSSDVGAVSMESVALTPMGLVFKSRKGWYLLDRGWNVSYIGAPVASFDADTINAIHVVETQHQVRILTNARMLVWDYYNATESAPKGQWAEWTISDGVHATMWNGSYVYLTATGPKIEQASYAALTYGLDVETSWIKPADLQGFARLWYIGILGEYRSACLVRVRVARDYQYDGAGNVVYFDDKAWAPSPTVVGSALQVRHSPSRSQGEAFKVRITAVVETVRASLATSSLSPQVTTSGTAWSSTWQAASSYPGEMGNALTMILAFEDSAGAAFSIDVRDHFAWSHAVQRWTEDIGNVGVRVLCRSGSSPTVAQLEAAIVAGTTLITLSAADATPAKVVSATGMLNLTSTGSLGSGAYGSPTGEAIRLTGLALEVGIEQGIYRRLTAAQKQ